MINKEKLQNIFNAVLSLDVYFDKDLSSISFDDIHNTIIHCIKNYNIIHLSDIDAANQVLDYLYLKDIDITDTIISTLLHKYELYKDSFLDEYNTYGSIIFTVRLTDKFNIIHNLSTKDILTGEEIKLIKEASLDYLGYLILILSILYDECNGFDNLESSNEEDNIIPIKNEFNKLQKFNISFGELIDEVIMDLQFTDVNYSFLNSILEMWAYASDKVFKSIINLNTKNSDIIKCIDTSLNLYNSILMYSNVKVKDKVNMIREIKELLKVRNEQYNDSFHKFHLEFGSITMLIRLQDKYNRLQNLIEPSKRKEELQLDSICDTLYDFIGYLILTYIELNRMY